MFVRQNIYALKRRYPQEVILCRTSSETIDLASGLQNETLTKVTVKKAVLLPTAFEEGKGPLSRLGFHEDRLRILLIDSGDVPTTFTIDLDIYVEFDGKRWEVQKVEAFDVNTAYVLQIRHTTGALLRDQVSKSGSDSIGPTDSVVQVP